MLIILIDIFIYNIYIYIYKYWPCKYVFTDISMCNTSAFAQNLRVTRIHQCSHVVHGVHWSFDCSELPFFRPNFKLLSWSTFPSRTCFPCKASCFNNLFVCTCCSWLFFIQDADVEWFSSAYIRHMSNTILIASYWNIVVHTWRWKDAHNSSWTECPSNEEPCDRWMIGHALLFFVAASKEPTEPVLTWTAFSHVLWSGAVPLFTSKI